MIGFSRLAREVLKLAGNEAGGSGMTADLMVRTCRKNHCSSGRSERGGLLGTISPVARLAEVRRESPDSPSRRVLRPAEPVPGIRDPEGGWEITAFAKNVLCEQKLLVVGLPVARYRSHQGSTSIRVCRPALGQLLASTATG